MNILGREHRFIFNSENDFIIWKQCFKSILPSIRFWHYSIHIRFNIKNCYLHSHTNLFIGTSRATVKPMESSSGSSNVWLHRCWVNFLKVLALLLYLRFMCAFFFSPEGRNWVEVIYRFRLCGENYLFIRVMFQ